MCGFCGYISSQKYDDSIIVEMSEVIKHRGPDSEGYFNERISDKYVSLAHRRLSILDLSSLGNQPMLSQDESIILVYNGEVYNYIEIENELKEKGYIFKSHCDTEMIICAYKEWGIGCLSKFNGMFSFALLDKNINKSYLVRDRCGVKPLYYFMNDCELVFSSEMKSLYKFPSFSWEINKKALFHYLHYQYITGSHTIFESTSKLRPGHYLEYDITNRNYRDIEYWNVRKVDVGKCKLDYNSAMEKLQNLLDKATNIRMISDVPIGTLLSGGIDSSLITAKMISNSSSTINTTTIGFEDLRYDESDRAKKIADFFNIKNVCEKFSEEMIEEYLMKSICYFDEPMADSSNLCTMYANQIVKTTSTVVLTGDAGDELFGGYEKYDDIQFISKYMKISILLNSLKNILPVKEFLTNFKNGRYLRLLYLNNDVNILNSDFQSFRCKYNGIVLNADSSIFDEYTKIDESLNILENAMIQDFENYMMNDVLVKVDRCGMAYQVEARSPLLDYRVVEFAFSLPLEYKYNKGNKKRILKDCLFEYIDKSLFDKKKRGFSQPFKKYLLLNLVKFEENIFSKQFIEKQKLFDYVIIKKILLGFKRSKGDCNGDLIWSLLIFQLWYEYHYLGGKLNEFI